MDTKNQKVTLLGFRSYRWHKIVCYRNPSWSNLISLNYKGEPILGLANFPILKKYYFNTSNKSSYIFEHGKKENKSKQKNLIF